MRPSLKKNPLWEEHRPRLTIMDSHMTFRVYPVHIEHIYLVSTICWAPDLDAVVNSDLK